VEPTERRLRRYRHAAAGNGEACPTSLGRGVGVPLMLLGIVVYGVVTANIAANVVGQEEDEAVSRTTDHPIRIPESGGAR
jgi:hypothetical protein